MGVEAVRLAGVLLVMPRELTVLRRDAHQAAAEQLHVRRTPPASVTIADE
jgi:hypothetical protein